MKYSKGSILVYFDIESPYSNIPHDLGLEAIAFWINRYPIEFQSRISNEFVLEGIKTILENNSFYFNDAYFLQSKGTAMGSKFVPILFKFAVAPYCYLFLLSVFILWFSYYVSDGFNF